MGASAVEADFRVIMECKGGRAFEDADDSGVEFETDDALLDGERFAARDGGLGECTGGSGDDGAG